MKIIVTGSLGNISLPLSKELIQKGHNVTLVSSKPEKQKEIEALGATPAIGTIEDVDFLANTFTGADAVYTMIPPPSHLGADSDPVADWLKIANNYAQAIQKSGVKRVVHLSSIGAHMDKDSGIIVGHRRAELLLSKLPNVAITFMRPVAFYYNLLNFIPVIKNAGMIVSNYGAEDMVAWVSPIDIAAAVAQEIVTPHTGTKVIYVASEELTCNQVAGILGEAIGKPDLKWICIPDEQMLTNLVSFGVPKQFAAGLVEMQSGMHKGIFFEDYNQHRPTLGKVKLKEYAKEFAAVYNKG